MRMKLLVMLIVTGVLLVLLAVSNPSPDRHKQAIRDSVYEGQPIASMLGLGVISSNLATYKSYALFSTMELDNQRVSLGALGRVWVDGEKLRVSKPGK
jgi:hypothetical protein